MWQSENCHVNLSLDHVCVCLYVPAATQNVFLTRRKLRSRLLRNTTYTSAPAKPPSTRSTFFFFIF